MKKIIDILIATYLLILLNTLYILFGGIRYKNK
jgi:hypothetical protein